MLTDTKLKSLRPKDRPYIVSDGRGLYAEVLTSGTVCWRYRYTLDGRQEKLTLGKYPDMPLALARAARDEAAQLVAAGISPAQRKQQKANERRAARELRSGGTLVKDYAEMWLSQDLQKKRDRIEQAVAWFSRDVLPVIGEKTMTQVTREDIRGIVFPLAERGAGASAAKVLQFVRRMFDHALYRGVVDVNPTSGIPVHELHAAKPRDRVLSSEELRLFLRALDESGINPAHPAAFKLLILTLARKSELLKAKWEDIDLDAGEWTIPVGNSKTGKAHIVYLSQQAISIFDSLMPLAGGSPFVLPKQTTLNAPASPSRLNRVLKDLKLSIDHFTIHDLRRTGATMLSEMGFHADVIERALNHELPGSSIRRVYNKAKFGPQRKEMLQFWADYVEDLTTARKVVPIRQKV